METENQLLDWARAQAQRLREGMRWRSGEYGDGWWTADQPTEKAKIVARATAAIEFLRTYAGSDSRWTKEAEDMYSTSGGRRSLETGCRGIGDLLESWAEQVEAGIISIPRAAADANVAIVSTDVMSQVRRLNEDKAAHPAAPIVLAGAALEVSLRSFCLSRDLELTERPSLTAWGRLLRANNLISVQDAKDLEQISGLRNLAAHGNFDELSRGRAGLLEQQVNMFLRKLEEL